MGSNRFLIHLCLMVVLIFFTALALAMLRSMDNRYFTQAFFAILLIVEARWLYQIVSRTNRDLSQFLVSVEENDMSTPIKAGRADKMFTGLYKTFEDIQKKIFELRESREREYQLYQIILNQTGSGLLLLNQKGSIELSNPAAVQLLGVGHLKDLNQLEQIIHGSRDFLNSLSGSSSKTWRFTRHGLDVELLTQSIPIKLEETQYSIISLQDIKKQLSEKAFQSQKNMIRILSHEINNTLTPITTLTDALIRNSGTPESMLNSRDDLLEGLDIIRDRGNSILDFVNSYQKLSHIPDPKMRWFKLKDLIHEIVYINQNSFQSQQIKLVGNDEIADEFLICGDKKMLGQVLQNILSNAVEALENTSDKIIRISSGTHYSGDTYLNIHDNGPGIPKNIREKLFIPFFSTKAQGNGIGLCLSQQIMHQHDGDIDFSTPVGGGTEIRLVFRSQTPCSEPEQGKPEKPQTEIS